MPYSLFGRHHEAGGFVDTPGRVAFEIATGALQFNVLTNDIFDRKARFDFLLYVVHGTIITLGGLSIGGYCGIIYHVWYNCGMESQEYLNQISAKPVTKKNTGGISGLLGSKIVWLVVGALGLFVLLAIVGAVLSGGKGDLKNDLARLQLHLENTSGVISEYQPKVKSSTLRSHSASLSTVLVNTNSKLSTYLTEQYNMKKNDDKDLAEQMKTEQDALTTELFEAKITGVLDRTYAHKMAYEISVFMAEEAAILKRSRNDTLSDIIKESYDSLETLYDSFNNFSENT